MPNIRYANMCHWKTIPYRQIPNFREFYYEDKTNSAYYSDWDSILKYQSALGFGQVGQHLLHQDDALPGVQALGVDDVPVALDLARLCGVGLHQVRGRRPR